MAFFQVHYSINRTEALRVTGWTNNRYSIDRRGLGRAGLLVLPERLVPQSSRLGAAVEGQFQAGELSRHERDRLRRRNAGGGCVASRCRHRGRPPGACAQAGFPARDDAGRNACKPGAHLSTQHRPETQRNARHIRHLRRGASARLLPELPGLQRRHADGAGSSSIPRPRALSAPSGAPGDMERRSPRHRWNRPCRSSRSWALPGWAWMTDGRRTKEIGPCCRRSFPNGDRDMKALVDKIHAQGFRAQLWWAPLAAKPESDVVKNHPEELLLNADGSKQKISYWNDWYFCPADRGGHRVPSPARHQDVSRLGLRRFEARRPAHERRAAVLQPRAQPRAPGGFGRGAAQVFQDDLRYGAQHQAGCAGGVLPLRHVVQLLHASEPEYERGLGSAQLLAGPHQGKDAQGAARRCHRLFRRSRGTERRAAGLCFHAGDRRRGRDAVHLAAGFGAAKPPGSHAG